MTLDFTDLPEPDPEGIPTRARERVLVLLRGLPVATLHDGLFCHLYHVIYDGWEVHGQSPNHWHVSIPRNRSEEAADATLVRARREVAEQIRDPQVTLEEAMDPEWNIQEWINYREERMLDELGRVQSAPKSLLEQVAYIMSNHDEARDSDKVLILLWNIYFGGWRPGKIDTYNAKEFYAIPLAYHHIDTTPESITDARRQWQQKGIFVASEEIQEARKDKEAQVRQAVREGRSPSEVI